MGVEIERKFLIANEDWRGQGKEVQMRQGYIAKTLRGNVRVRVAGEKGLITVKGRSYGISRKEYEYDIPLADAEEMLNIMCEKPLIEKTRHKVKHGNHLWEIDEFYGDNQGLIVAEVEMGSEDEHVEIPDWIGQEVTGDKKYYNASLVNYPFNEWEGQEQD